MPKFKMNAVASYTLNFQEAHKEEVEANDYFEAEKLFENKIKDIYWYVDDLDIDLGIEEVEDTKNACI